MSISNDEIYNALLEIKQDIGVLMANGATTTKAFDEHIEADKTMAKDIDNIRLSMARQKGSVRTWGMVATGLAAIISAFGAIWKHT